MSPGRHCLTRQTASLPGQTLSHPAHSLSAWSDIVSPGRQPLWPGRHCLAEQTMSDPAHNLSDPANTRQIVRCLGMLTHARSYLNPLSGIPEGSIDSIDRGSLRARSIDRLDRKSIGDPLGLDRSTRLDSIESRSGLDMCSHFTALVFILMMRKAPCAPKVLSLIHISEPTRPY